MAAMYMASSTPIRSSSSPLSEPTPGRAPSRSGAAAIVSFALALAAGACGGGGGDVVDLQVSGYRLSGPSFSPDGSLMAVVALDEAGAQEEAIAVVGRDGSGFTILAQADTYLAGTAFSPDGESVVYTGDGGVYRVPVAGGDPELLVDAFAATSPDMSPDGTQVLYTVNGAGVEVAAVADGVPTGVGNGSAWSAKFSPDGTRVAYFSGSEIRVVDVTGENDASVLALTDSFLGSVDWLDDDTLVFMGEDSIDSWHIPTSTRTRLRDEFVALELSAAGDGSAVAYGSNPSSSITILEL
jgi:hypothetical protein